MGKSRGNFDLVCIKIWYLSLIRKITAQTSIHNTAHSGITGFQITVCSGVFSYFSNKKCFFLCKILIIFILIYLNLSFECSREQSHRRFFWVPTPYYFCWEIWKIIFKYPLLSIALFTCYLEPFVCWKPLNGYFGKQWRPRQMPQNAAFHQSSLFAQVNTTLLDRNTS